MVDPSVLPPYFTPPPPRGSVPRGGVPGSICQPETGREDRGRPRPGVDLGYLERVENGSYHRDWLWGGEVLGPRGPGGGGTPTEMWGRGSRGRGSDSRSSSEGEGRQRWCREVTGSPDLRNPRRLDVPPTPLETNRKKGPPTPGTGRVYPRASHTHTDTHRVDAGTVCSTASSPPSFPGVG